MTAWGALDRLLQKSETYPEDEEQNRRIQNRIVYNTLQVIEHKFENLWSLPVIMNVTPPINKTFIWKFILTKTAPTLKLGRKVEGIFEHN